MVAIATPYTHTIALEEFADGDRDALLLEQEELQLPVLLPAVPLLRRKNCHWMLALPPCVFDPKAQALTPDREAELYEAAVRCRKSTGSYGFHRARDVVFTNGRWYYHRAFLVAVGPYLATPHLVRALANFLQIARRNPDLIYKAPPPSHRRPVKTPADRIGASGRHTRGPAWEPWEDAILQRWFARHEYGEHAGKHAKLTPERWQIVLRDLKDRRTPAGVKARITILNRQLRRSLIVDGFITREGVVEYQRRALGEGNVPLPRYRPRIKGRSYLGDNARPLLDQPE